MVKIAGILNITPDSFSDGGKYFKLSDALRHAEKLISEGADILDVGGESSRPGSIVISENEEIRRVIPIIRQIKKKIPKIPISIDTYKSKVAEIAIDEGAEIVNDIFGLGFQNGEMADIVAKKKVSVVIMHMLGTPQNMQKNPRYKNIISDIYRYFEDRIEFAKSKGIRKEKIILDPGIGFGKTVRHNLMIFKHLSEFKKLKLPVMLGPSRKSFIGKLLDTDVCDRLEGTIAASLISVANGADFLRVHDVLQIRKAIAIFEAIQNA
ncbi:MAG: dihydropteroate synthase [Elusimicrobia bacterium RIFOXYD2_FULL_34_15]|nr:MAG: dihydropteroate synthase [Elusimicrobia bacterium RIFOXYD2_FULL_34_15]